MITGLNISLPIYTLDESRVINYIKDIFNINLPFYKLYILIYKHNNIYNKFMYLIITSLQQNAHNRTI